MSERFIVQPSEKEGFWVCTDTENLLCIIWEDHNFNDNQEVKEIEGFNPENYMKMARIMGEFGDYLQEHHYEKIF